jgi:hypothetical protein
MLFLGYYVYQRAKYVLVLLLISLTVPAFVSSISLYKSYMFSMLPSPPNPTSAQQEEGNGEENENGH